jgi:hypothetical protein
MDGGGLSVKPLGSPVMELPESLVGGDPDRGGQVERAQGLLIEAGQVNAVIVADFLMQPVGAAVALAAEEEGVPRLEAGLPVGPAGVGGEEPDAAGEISGLAESLP